MAAVGDLFEKRILCGRLIFAAELMTSAFEILKPVLGSASSAKVGTILLGTVAGDLHDIGKNIFKNMAEAAGFEFTTWASISRLPLLLKTRSWSLILWA